MAELKFTGNYLRGSRPFLYSTLCLSALVSLLSCCNMVVALCRLIADCRCFDASFDGEPFLQVLRPHCHNSVLARVADIHAPHNCR